MRSWSLAVFLGFYLSLSCVSFAQAQAPVIPSPGQATVRSVEGAVRNRDNSPVPGAIVLLKNMKTLQIRSYIALANGEYHFYGLSSDVNYELRAQANGLTSSTKLLTVFNSHPVVKIDLKLKKQMKR